MRLTSAVLVASLCASISHTASAWRTSQLAEAIEVLCRLVAVYTQAVKSAGKSWCSCGPYAVLEVASTPLWMYWSRATPGRRDHGDAGQSSCHWEERVWPSSVHLYQVGLTHETSSRWLLGWIWEEWQCLHDISGSYADYHVALFSGTLFCLAKLKPSSRWSRRQRRGPRALMATSHMMS